MLSIVNIVLGASLLLAGRRLFWLFVMAGGFIAGVQFATSVVKGPEWLTIIIGLVTGIVFAILARFFQTVVIGLAGFFLGGSILNAALNTLGFDIKLIGWIIGGVIGVILISVLFDWALISLSSIGGAVLLVQALHLISPMRGIAFLVLLVLGILVQAANMRGEKGRRSESTE